MEKTTKSCASRKPLPTFVIMMVMLALMFATEAVLAQTPPGTGGLPYEEGLQKFRKSLEGPVPFAISLVGIVACGAMLIFGGEISGFMRTMIFIILVVAVIVQAGSVVSMLGGDATATGGLKMMDAVGATSPRNWA